MIVMSIDIQIEIHLIYSIWTIYWTHCFTKLLQNMRPVNTHILMYWYTKCNCKLWNLSWFCCVFLRIFIHNCLSEVMYHPQTFTDFVFNVIVLNVTANYARFSELITFLGYFLYIFLQVWNVITSSNFYRLYVAEEEVL